jgi:hypothetical protein
MKTRVVEVAGDAGGDLLLDLLGGHALALAGHQVLDGLGVEHDGLGPLGDLDLDVLVDQLDGLGAQRVPDEPAGDVGGPHGLVDVGEPLVVVAVRLASIGSGLSASHSCDTTLYAEPNASFAVSSAIAAWAWISPS